MNPQDILKSIGRDGWRIVSRQPEMAKMRVTDTSGNAVDRVQATGNEVWTINGPGGQNEAVVVKPTQTSDSVPNTNATGVGRITYELVKAPTTTPSVSLDKPTQVSAPASEQNILTRDPNTGALTVVANPNYQPGKESVTLGNKVYERQADGTYKVVLEGDKAPKVIGGTAPTDKQIILQDANGAVSYLDNPNYQGTKPTTIGGGAANDQYILQEQPDGTIKQVASPNYVAPKPTTIGGGSTTDQFILQQQPDGSIKQVPNPNYVAPKPTVVSTNTDAPVLTFIDANGNLSTQPNPNYQAPKPDVLNPNSVAPFIPILERGADGQWTIKQVANPNQQTVSSAVLGLYQGLKDAVGAGDGQIPLDEAKDLLTAGYQAMQVSNERQRDATTAANDALTAADRGAQTGATILNNRATMARDTLNQTLSPVENNKNFGLGGGLPAGFGSTLLGGISDWTAQMAGGQDVLKTASDMVHNANPTLAGTPAGAGYTALLSQMLQAKQSQDTAARTTFTPPTGTTVPALVSPDAANAAAQLDNSVGSGMNSGNTGVAVTPSGQVVFNLHFHPGASPAPGQTGSLDQVNTGTTV